LIIPRKIFEQIAEGGNAQELKEPGAGRADAV
jgi:hypothetical protein